MGEKKTMAESSRETLGHRFPETPEGESGENRVNRYVERHLSQASVALVQEPTARRTGPSFERFPEATKSLKYVRNSLAGIRVGRFKSLFE